MILKNLSDCLRDFFMFRCFRDGSFGWIGNINYAGLNRKDLWGTTKQFEGEVKTWNNDQKGLDYLVTGDFYNYGNTTKTYGYGVNIPSVSFGFSITSRADHFLYWHSGQGYMKIVP